MNFLKNKKILLVGLGRLGGGIATAKSLVERGAKLTITDLNSAKELKSSLAKLEKLKIKYVLGEHRKEDFLNNDIIIFNQAVSVNNIWVRFADENKKRIETDLSLMLKILEKEKPQMKYIAITGTRGKTTTAAWAHYFLKPAHIGGNIPALAPLKILDRIILRRMANQNDTRTPLILEIPSYQLEYWELNKNLKAPKIAVITNLYIDHLNRHGDMKNYALAKSRIFSNQSERDFLILNYDLDNALFLKQKPKSAIFYISLKPLPKNKNGLYFKKQKIIFQNNGKNEFVVAIDDFSAHQKYNLLNALLAAKLYGKEWPELVKKITSLPSVPFRQEVVLKTKNITAINDSSATSPEGTMVAIERFKKDIKKAALICGGTDKQLDFKNLARMIKKEIPENNLFLLNGSATRKLVAELNSVKAPKPPLKGGQKGLDYQTFENLKDIITEIKKRKDLSIVLFSPGAASFEKFKNEFDRGRKFNKLVREKF